MIASSLSELTYDLAWVDENTLAIFDHENSEAITVNVKTKEVVREKHVLNEEEERVKLFEPNGKDKIIATCAEQNLEIRGGSIKDEQYEISLWKQERVVATFPFSSKQWKDRDGSPNAYYSFSPSCNYFSLVLYGEISVEFYAKEELWLLDVQNKSFELALTGGQYPAWGDSPVQRVAPSWSPNEQEFVFGDSEFGLETYNIVSGKQRFIVGPRLRPYNPQWSPSGEWIAAISFRAVPKNDALIVIAPDGKKMATSTRCWLIDEFAWSPTGKQLAYLCSESISHEGSLWVWELDQ
jgi:hypothetical protein